jgi:hypothetical protein
VREFLRTLRAKDADGNVDWARTFKLIKGWHGCGRDYRQRREARRPGMSEPCYSTFNCYARATTTSAKGC